MSWVGYALQIVGMAMTGYAAIAAFSIDMSEASMFTWGLGGLAVFVLGGQFRGGN